VHRELRTLGSEEGTFSDRARAVAVRHTDTLSDPTSGTIPAFFGEAHTMLPWTQITPESADLFAWAVRHLPSPFQSGPTPVYYDRGLDLSVATFIESGIAPCWTNIHLLASAINRGDPQNGHLELEAARDRALTAGIDQINGVALRNGLHRLYLRDHAAGSSLSAHGFDGFAAEVASAWQSNLALLYNTLLLVLARETVCPADYNRDGSITSADLSAFNAAHSGSVAYADWDFDGDHDQDDIDMFEAVYYNSPCPCP
jgi:hypothetical protein